MKNKWLSLFITFFSAITTYSQVYMTSETNVKEATNNDVIFLTIAIEISGEDFIQESPVKFPDFHKFDIIDFSSEQNTIIDPVRKVRVNQMVYQFLLQPKQSGAIKIGSALVKVNGKLYKSEPFDITIKDVPRRIPDNRNLASQQNNSTYLTVKLDEKEVYKNQSFVATLSLVTRDFDNFRKIKNIHPPKNGNLIIQPISLHKSDIEQDQKTGLMTQLVGVYIVFPKKEGTVELPSFSADLDNTSTNRIHSNKASINVKALPKNTPVDYKDFVGNFSVEMTKAENIPQPIEVNKPIDIVVKMIGQGNLSPHKMPKIISTQDYDVFPPKLVKNLKTLRDGITGDIEAHYIIIPKRAGNFAVKTEKTSFFNPKKKEYKDLGEQSIILHAMTTAEIDNSKTALQKVNEYTNTVLEKVNTPILQTNNLKIKEQNGINWLVVLGNLTLVTAIGFVLFLLRNSYQKKKLLAVIKEQDKSKTTKIITIAETEELLRQQLKFDLDNHLLYLETLLNQKKYNTFFQELTKLKDDINSYCHENFDKNFISYLQNIDPTKVEAYQQILEDVNIVKYAPTISDERLLSILNQLKILYKSVKD